MSLLTRVIKKTRRYFSGEQKELRRLARLPRYTPARTSLVGNIELTDAASFVVGYDEIFKRENYYFDAAKPDPYIIDCGSNIGLSIIYFKKLYPNAKVIAFEPDPAIFKVLKRNINSLGLQNVELNNKAVAGVNGELSFLSEGGFSGRLTSQNGNSTVRVPAVTLDEYLDQPVDFLKIDIEGTEWEVLQQIQPFLKNVSRLFIEYHSIDESEQELDKILALLKQNHFRVHIKEAYTANRPFRDIPLVAGMDNQLEIYAWRN